MKKIVEPAQENYFSPFSHNTASTPKIERIKLNSLLSNQDNIPTPANQIPLKHSSSQHSQIMQQQYPNLLDNLLQSANLGGVLLNFENPIVFNDAVYEDNSKHPFNHNTGQISSPNGMIYKQSLKDYRIKQHQLKKSNQMAKRIQKKQDNRPKIFVNKSTDTTEDLKLARLAYDRIEKENQVSQIQRDIDENIADLTKYLKTTTEIKINFSGVTQQIKEVAKALQKKKFDTDQMLARENAREDEPGDPEEELKIIKDYLESEFKDVQKETALKIIEFINRVSKERRAQPEKSQSVILQYQEISQFFQKNKKTKGNKDKGVPKKDQELQQLKDRVGFLENKYEENNKELDNKLDELKDLKFQVDYKDKDLTKLNTEIHMTKDELNKAEVDKRHLQQQIEKSKQQQDKLSEQKILEEKQKEKIQQKLKKTEDRVIDIQRENYMLRDEIVRTQQLSKNVDEQEKINMQILCQMVMDSNMSPEEQKKALMRIQQLYVDHPSGNVEINQERQKYIQQMMNSFKSTNVRTFEELEQLNQKSRQSFSKLSLQDFNENATSRNKKPVKLSNKSSFTHIEEEDTEITYKKEKRIIKQKVMKTVTQKKIIIDENGQEVEIEEQVEVETEEDVEVEVDIPVVKSKNQKQGKTNQKKSDKVVKSSANNSNNPSNSNSRRTSKRGNSYIQQGIQPINVQKNNNQSNTPRKTQFSGNNINLTDREGNNDVQPSSFRAAKDHSTQKKEVLEIQNEQKDKPKPIVFKKLEGYSNLGENVLFNEDDFYEEVEQEIEEQDGFEEIEEQTVDKNGKLITVKKTVPKMVKKTIKLKKKISNLGELELIDQEQEIEEVFIDPETGESKIIKKKVMQKVAVPKSKLLQNYEFIEQESIVEESFIDPDTGETKTIQKKVIKKVPIPKSQLNNYKIESKEIEIEEEVFNPETGLTQIIKKKVIQKIARKIEEGDDIQLSQQSSVDYQQFIPQPAKKKGVRQVMVEKEIEVEEDEEIIDSSGNKQIIKRKVKKVQMVPQFEEFEEDEEIFDENLHILQTNNQNNGKSTIDSNQTQPSVKQGVEMQSTQTDQFLLWPIIEAILYELDVDPSKIEVIQKKYFDEKSSQESGGMSLNLMDLAKQVQQRKQQFEERQEQKQQEQLESDRIQKEQSEFFQKYHQASQDPFSRNDEDLLMFNENSPTNFGPDGRALKDDDEVDERNFEILDDKHLLAESTIKKIFLKLQTKDNKGAIQIKELIRKYYNKPKNSPISYDEFKHYYLKVLTLHQKCGDFCPHLARFFGKIGFKTNRYDNRKEIKPVKQKLNPFNEQQTKSPNFNPNKTPVSKAGLITSNQNSVSKSSFTQAAQNKIASSQFQNDLPSTPYRNTNNTHNLSSSTTKLPKIGKDGAYYSGYK